MIESQRHLFDIPDDVAFFNAGYMSPLPKASAAAGEAALRRKSTPWMLTPEDFFTETNTFRSLAARLIEADTNDVAIIPSASYGLAIAAKNIPLQSGAEILVLEDQFPSNIYCWQRVALEKGAVIKTVPVPQNRDWTDAVLSAITNNTAVAALPHNHWADGGLLDLIRIREALDTVGAKLVLDTTQSLGAMPLSVKRVRPDFLVAAAYKWLMCPYSTGFMYVAPEFQNGTPIEENWLNRKGSEDFAGLVNYKEDYQPGAIRFDMGERANFGLIPAAIASLQQLLDWGVENIQATLKKRNSEIMNALSDTDITAIPDQLRAGHFLGLEYEAGFPDDILGRLAAQKIYASKRGNSLRITPHLYNNNQDFERLTEALKQILT